MSKELGIRLRYLRIYKTRYNQNRIAELLHVERSTYTKYESGDTEPSIATLIRLRHILGVSYEELLEAPLSEKEIADYHDAHYMRKE